MRAKKLILKNFRNFDNLELNFNPGLTVITGMNGSGKTNILEALYMCSIGRSPRTRQDNLLIQKGKTTANIELDFIRAETERSVGVNLSNTKGKSIILDGVPSAKVSDIVGNFSCVYFSPDEIEIVRGGPQYRRRFLDIINCQISPNYMINLKNFQHALKQRNALLKTIKVAGVYDKNLLPWDEQIMSYSLKIMLRRYNFLKGLQKLVGTIMRILTDNRETLRLTYRTFCDRLEQVHINDLEEVYKAKVRQNYVRDCLTHTSSIGPHLDDFDIKLCYINNAEPYEGRGGESYEYINLRNEGSLGQQRTATLALKIAEVFLYHKFYGEKPMLFLDDVLSELDFVRRHKLMSYCKNFDTVVTCTEWTNENPTPDTLYRVDNGVVTKLDVQNSSSFKQENPSKVNALGQAFDYQPNSAFWDNSGWPQPLDSYVTKETSQLIQDETIDSIPQEKKDEIMDELEKENQDEAEYDIWTDDTTKKTTKKSKK